MDKDILRIVIIIIGVLAVIGMLAWSFFKNQQAKRKINFYDDGDPLGKIDESLVINSKDDDFDIIPLGGAKESDDFDDQDIFTEDRNFPVQEAEDDFQPALKHHASEPEEEPELAVPNILQFIIVAKEQKQFSGEQLQSAFSKVGLNLGSNQVFERLDEYDQVDFAVASMVEPGIFPKEDFDSFSCPGIVFFFQPNLVNDALLVFDDLMDTLHILSTELDGIEWDQDRKLLTSDTQKMIRKLLVEAKLSL